MAKRSSRRRVQRATRTHILELRSVGPITQASLELGDLTVLVGPQASGKSIALQTLKLVLDQGPIRTQLERFGFNWAGPGQFSQVYFGEGTQALLEAPAEVAYDGEEKSLDTLLRSKRSTKARVFYVPAQRVMSVRDGVTQPFTQFQGGDPFVLRDFSETTHNLIQQEFVGDGPLFPQKNRLTKKYREALSDALFGGFSLRVDAQGLRRRLVLSKDGTHLPFGVWSAGQREFVPLLLGLYWLIPAGGATRRNDLEWVVIEEPEAGLHPRAIVVVMTLVLELLHRGYRVCLSTHSTHVLDFVWALGVAESRGGTEDDVLDLIGLGNTDRLREVAATALRKTYKVHYLERNSAARDISSLDPGADDESTAHWGGLTSFAGRAGDVVARIVNRGEVAP